MAITGDELYDLKAWLGVTQLELAERIGVTTRTLSRWLQTGVPRSKEILVLNPLGDALRQLREIRSSPTEAPNESKNVSNSTLANELRDLKVWMGSELRSIRLFQASESSDFSWRLLNTIRELILARGLTDVEVIERSGVPHDVFYRKMRGDAPLNTDDIAKLARALSVDPYTLFGGDLKNPLNEPLRSDGPNASEVGRRIALLVSARARLNALSHDYKVIASSLSGQGIKITEDEWGGLFNDVSLPEQTLIDIANAFGVDPVYFNGDENDPEVARIEAQLDLLLVLGGGGIIAARGVGDISPELLRSIAAYIRKDKES